MKKRLSLISVVLILALSMLLIAAPVSAEGFVHGKDIQGVRSEKEMVTDYRTNIDAGDSQLS